MEKTELKITLTEHTGKRIYEANELGIEYPLYMQCYEEALSAVLKSIDYNQTISRRRETQKSIFIGAEREYTASVDAGNIIAFIGNRGSGKTTAVNEFCRVLYDYCHKSEKWDSKITYKNDGNIGYHFHVLTPIDASVLSSKEDLLEVILANMYQVFQAKVKEEKSQTLKNELIKVIGQEFDEVYKDYISVGNHDEQKILGETTLVKLRNTSNSLKTKAVFEKLIMHFLRFLGENEYVCENEKKSYLVVTIDDLDMNPENGYEMLEQLHKYLSSSRVIILVAIRYDQMQMICEKHFVDCLIPEYGSTHISVFNKFEEEAKKLSNDYLLKVIPPSNRIYMPERELLYKRGIITKPDSDSMDLSVKNFILKKIAIKMNIFYDAMGLKKHFCLPYTVRELVAYNDFLNSLFSMREIEQPDVVQAQKQMVLYDQNHERFNRDIEDRMALQILSYEQIKVYRLILERSIERRAKYAVNFIRSWLANKTLDKELKKSRLKDNVDEQDYCYADLLEGLYVLGRADYEDKVLVHCLIASFTSEMVREYYSYLYNTDKEARDRSADRLILFLGRAFGGKWFDDTMPTVVASEDRRMRIRVGYVQNASLMDRKIEISYKKQWGQQETKKKIICILADIVPCMECLMLLLSNFRDKSGKLIFPEWSFRLNEGESEDGKILKMIITNTANSVDFDIFGFIGKEIVRENGEKAAEQNIKSYADARKWNKELRKALEKCLVTYFVESESSALTSENEKKLLSQFNKLADKKSIWYMYEDRKKAVFPFYNLDMSYNIMKRVKANISKNVRISEQEICDYFSIVYGYVAQELYEEREKYRVFMNQEMVPDFYEDFVSSPFIKAFGITCKDSTINQDGKLDKKCLSSILIPLLGSLEPNVIPSIDEQNLKD